MQIFSDVLVSFMLVMLPSVKGKSLILLWVKSKITHVLKDLNTVFQSVDVCRNEVQCLLKEQDAQMWDGRSRNLDPVCIAEFISDHVKKMYDKVSVD